MKSTPTAVTAANVPVAFRAMQRAADELDLGACAPAKSATAAAVNIPTFFASSRPASVHVIACVYNMYNGIELFYTDPPSSPKPCRANDSECTGGVYGTNFVITDIEHPDQRGACVAMHQLPGFVGLRPVDDDGQPLSC